jgi:hypothetical protein
MIRSAIRTRLRRRVNDVQADTWSNSELNDVINDAMHDMQMAMLAVNKNAIVYRWRANIVSAQTEYSLPSGMLWETEVRILDSTSGDYLPIDKWSKKEVEKAQLGQLTLSSDQPHVYAIEGQSLHLAAAPASSVTDGIEISGVPTLDMGADTDVPELPIAFHMVIVYYAELLLKPEGNDDTKQAEQAVARWQTMLPTMYRASGGAETVKADLTKDW